MAQTPNQTLDGCPNTHTGAQILAKGSTSLGRQISAGCVASSSFGRQCDFVNAIIRRDISECRGNTFSCCFLPILWLMLFFPPAPDPDFSATT